MKYTSQGNVGRSRNADRLALTAALTLAWGSSACALVPQAATAPGPAAAQAPANPPQTIEMTRSCAIENGLWVCRYQPPANIIATDPVTVAAPTVLASPAGTVAAVDPERVEEAKLMVRCATATWLSLCTPSERREARRLREQADRREALRRDVTRLLSQNECAAAARTALEGADMALALEVRAWCEHPATPH